MDCLELAKKQFFTLKEETLNNDRESLGAENEQDYDIDGIKLRIKVDGFWEKSTWFNWTVYDDQGTKLAFGTYEN